MVWATISGAGTTTATKFHGDVMNKINNMLGGVDVSDTVTINSAVIWTFEDGAFKLEDSDASHDYIFAASNLAADRTITLPLLTGNDTLVVEAEAATLTNKTINADNNTISNIGLAEIEAAGKTEVIAIAASDESTALTTGTAKVTFHMPYAFTLTDIKATVTTAPTDATLIADVNDGGTSIMTTDKLDIETGEFSTETATTPPALTDTALAADAIITVDIDQVGSTIAGTGLKIYLIGYQT